LTQYSSSYNLPNLNVKESEKGEAFHRAFCDSLISRSLNSTWSTEFGVMDECYKYFDKGSDSSQFGYMTSLPDGSQLPAQWQPINKIFNKVMVLLGELMEKGYDFDVKAINKEARSRKLDAKEEARVMMRIAPVLQEVDQYAGLQSELPQLPENEEDLDEFFDKNYKEEAEIVMYYILKYLDKKNGWGYQRMALFRDLLIAGRCIVAHEIKNGIPVTRQVDPRFFIFDTFASNDFGTDSTYYGEVQYMPMAEAAVEYSLTMEEMNEAYAKYQDFMRVLAAKSSTPQRNIELNSFGSLRGESGLKWFKESPGGLRVLVFKAYWRDTKKYKVKESEDNYGEVHTKRLKSDAADREGVTSKNFAIWRTGTLIGGKFMKKWGVMENMARDNDPDKISECEAPYTILLPNFVNGRTVSPTERSRGLQNLKDIITYNITLAMARAGGKGFIYDVAQCPDEWDVDTVIKYLKTVGIGFINSKQGGTPAQFNQFQQFDLSLSSSVSQYLELTQWVDSEMDSVFGVNEARQGVVQGASQAVGVTRSALFQSALTTAPYFKMFDMFASRVWNTQAKMAKLSWANKEKFAPIIGDAGVDFLSNDVDMDLDDYAVFVEATPKLLDDLNNFQQIVMAALNAGQVSFKDALLLLQEKDVMSGVRKFERITAENEAAAAEAEQQAAEQEHQFEMERQAQQIQMQGEYNERQAQQAAQREQFKQQAKSQGDLEMEKYRQRGQFQEKKIDIYSDREKYANDRELKAMEIEARKKAEKAKPKPKKSGK
jgi:regulator of protease activity HflC (stomatin/prohibitin superfamily)